MVQERGKTIYNDRRDNYQGVGQLTQSHSRTSTTILLSLTWKIALFMPDWQYHPIYRIFHGSEWSSMSHCLWMSFLVITEICQLIHRKLRPISFYYSSLLQPSWLRLHITGSYCLPTLWRSLYTLRILTIIQWSLWMQPWNWILYNDSPVMR